MTFVFESLCLPGPMCCSGALSWLLGFIEPVELVVGFGLSPLLEQVREGLCGCLAFGAVKSIFINVRTDRNVRTCYPLPLNCKG